MSEKTCPVCGLLSEEGAEDVTCAGVEAWGTAHEPTSMVSAELPEAAA